MIKRAFVASFVALVFVVSLFSPGHASAAHSPKTFSLGQSHMFDDMLSKDGFAKRFGKDRVASSDLIELNFTDSIDVLLDHPTGVDVKVTSREGKNIHLTMDGGLTTIPVADGTAIYGSFHGSAGKEPIDLTFTYDAKGNNAWSVVSFGAINSDGFAIETFGTKHALVDEVVQALKARSKQRASARSAASSPSTVSSFSSTATPPQGYAAVYFTDSSCNGQTFTIGAQYSFGPNNVGYGQSIKYGGRVFTNSSGVTALINCKYGSNSWNQLSIDGATNTITLPVDFYGSGPDPAASADTYTIYVPLYLGNPLAWQVQTITLQGKSITPQLLHANGSGNPNQLVHTWKAGISFGYDPSVTDYDPSVGLYAQQNHGWAGQALFSYQNTVSGSDVVWQNTVSRYSFQWALGPVSGTVSSGDYGWRLYYGP